MRILVTAFEPFGSDSENASAAALRALLAVWSDPVIELVGEELPVVFDDAPLRRAVAEHRPDLLVALGEAGGRRAITPERRGRNEISARIPDNAGAQPQGEPVEPGAPDERAAAVDVDRLVAAMREAGWAAEPSDDAGGFVCNYVAFHAYGLDVQSVFIHVPAVRSEGEATVGAETGGAIVAAEGREPRTSADIADALAAGIRRLRPSSPRSGPATTA